MNKFDIALIAFAWISGIAIGVMFVIPIWWLSGPLWIQTLFTLGMTPLALLPGALTHEHYL